MKALRFWIIGVLLLIALGFAIRTAAVRWKEHVIEQQHRNLKEQARTLLQDQNPEAAWDLLNQHRDLIADAEWESLRRQALVERRNIQDLITEFESAPQNIIEDEGASLLIGRAMIHQREFDSFAKLSELWIAKKHDTNQWVQLGIDAQLLDGDVESAWAKLSSFESATSLNANHLIQRALIKGSTNSVAALEDLDLALTLNSQSPSLRSFRAQLLESLGDNELARVEYVAAHLAAPANPLWRDQLAEFYRRHSQFEFALDTWAPGRAEPLTDFIWLKSAFCSRIASPYEFPSAPTLPTGPLAEIAKLVLALPADQFWNDQSARALSASDEILATRQEIYWLRILQDLRDGNESAAAEKLNSRPDQQAIWDIFLHQALLAVLQYRTQGHFAIENSAALGQLSLTPNQHDLFHQLKAISRDEVIRAEAPKVPADLDRLLKGPNAFTAVFLASGWRQATLTFLRLSSDPNLDQYPSWFHYGITQTLRYTDTNESALAYLEARPKSPELQLLEGELLIANNQQEKGLSVLRPLAKLSTAVGNRATWLLAVDHINQAQYEQALALIAAHPILATSRLGLELKGKIAERRKDLESAARIYESIAGESAQAQRFLADQAFRQEDYPSARRHTLLLLQANPSDLNIMANLRAIDAAIEAQE